MDISVIITAAGVGKRTHLNYNKVMYQVGGKPLLVYLIDVFKNDEDVKEILLTVKKEEQEMMQKYFGSKVDKIIVGGSTRQESVYNGIKHATSDYIFIQDGARLLVNPGVLNRLKRGLEEFDSVSPYIHVADTLKTHDKYIMKDHVNRDNVVQIQTPQCFHRSVILTAHNEAQHNNYPCDASLVKEVLGVDTLLVSGDRKHIKFTIQDDLDMMELIIRDTYRK